MTTLVLCLNEYVDAGMTGNPALNASALGVKWDEFIPCPISDRIILKGCTGIPAQMPRWLQPVREK